MRKKKVNNLTMKIVAMFFAIILWSYVMSEVNPRITKEIPNVNVELLGIETLEQSNLVLMEPKEVTITVKISGMRNEMFNVTEEDIVAQVDVRGYQEGTYKVPIEVINPLNVDRIVDFYPKQIPFEFDEIVEKQVPVNLNFNGSPRYGYCVGEWSARPSTILIRGPRTWVNTVSKVLATVDVSNFSKNFKTSVPVTILDENDREVVGVEKEPNIVDINIPILKLKNVKIDPVIEGNLLESFKIVNITSNPRTVNIRGSEEKIDNVFTIKTMPIDINNMTESFETMAQLVVPEGVEITGEIDPFVKIKIEKIIQKTFEYTIDDIELTNLNQKLKLDNDNNNEKISFTVEGTESIINHLSNNDLKPSIDLRNLDEGTYELDINIVKPQNVEILNIEPKKLQFTLMKVDNDAVEE